MRVYWLTQGTCSAQVRCKQLEWRSRRLNIEIHDVLETPNEYLINKIDGPETKLDIPPVSPSDIQLCTNFQPNLVKREGLSFASHVSSLIFLPPKTAGTQGRKGKHVIL